MVFTQNLENRKISILELQFHLHYLWITTITYKERCMQMLSLPTFYVWANISNFS